MTKCFILASFLLYSCGNPICAWNLYGLAQEPVTNEYGEIELIPILFDTNFNEYTEDGVAIDRWSADVSLAYIDDTVERMVFCVNDLINSNYSPLDVAQCIENPLRPRQAPCLQECLKIKIVEPTPSECSEWNFIGPKAPQWLCDAKELEYDPELCPCRWRCVIQRDYELITTTDDKGLAYLWDVVKIMTGCNNIWEDVELTKCANIR